MDGGGELNPDEGLVKALSESGEDEIMQGEHRLLFTHLLHLILDLLEIRCYDPA